MVAISSPKNTTRTLVEVLKMHEIIALTDRHVEPSNLRVLRVACDAIHEQPRVEIEIVTEILVEFVHLLEELLRVNREFGVSFEAVKTVEGNEMATVICGVVASSHADQSWIFYWLGAEQAPLEVFMGGGGVGACTGCLVEVCALDEVLAVG